MNSKIIGRPLTIAATAQLVLAITAILFFGSVSAVFASAPCLAKDTTIIVDVYSGMTRTIHFKVTRLQMQYRG
jgi:hypothetical protein